VSNILIVEDQESLGLLYKQVLRQFNHNVIVAPDGLAGVAAATQGTPDLIILDLMLPGMPGTEVAAKLKELGILPAAPLIVTTAVGSDDAQAIARSMGAQGVLSKPFNISSLINIVREALAGSQREVAAA